MITLAFYKGRSKNIWGRVMEGAIRFVTRSPYSHVEVTPGVAFPDTTHVCYSSSGRDGGVRTKEIFLSQENWDLITIPGDEKSLTEYFSLYIGAKYDYIGIILSQLCAFGRHSKSRWFCSEIIASALKIPQPQRISPQILHDFVTWRP